MKKPLEGIAFGSLSADGAEQINPVPHAPPIKLQKRRLSTHEEIARVMRAVSKDVSRQGAETMEEANDFDLPGEEPTSPYEFDEDAALEQRMAELRQSRFAARRASRKAVAKDPEPSSLAQVDIEDLTSELERRKGASKASS